MKDTAPTMQRRNERRGADGRNDPRLTHMVFQGMFFIITPALICGAFAERMKFSTMVVFTILWGTLIYCPLATGSGRYRLAELREPTTAGGRPSTSRGGRWCTSARGCRPSSARLVIGRRLGHGQEPMPPHNLTYTCIGAALLWVGWFGFNAGSALGGRAWRPTPSWRRTSRRRPARWRGPAWSGSLGANPHPDTCVFLCGCSGLV